MSPVDNSDYLDPDGFTGINNERYPEAGDRCSSCHTGDSNQNWLLFMEATQNWVCETCANR